MAYTTIKKSTNYFNTKLYTGTGASLANTEVGFQPDLTWIKSRDTASNHALYDSSRGIQKIIESNSTNTETTQTNGLSAFGSDGFTIGDNSQINTNGGNYASWNWLTNSAASANTDGTINSSVSANLVSGVSLASYTGNGLNAATVGSGLSSLDCVMVKDLNSSSGNWVIKHKSLTTDNNLYLNSDIQKDTASTPTVIPSFGLNSMKISERGYFIKRNGASGSGECYIDQYDFDGTLIQTLTSTYNETISNLRVTGSGNWLLAIGNTSPTTTGKIMAWYLSNSSRNLQHLPGKSYSSGNEVLAKATSDGLWYLWTATTTTTVTPDNSVSDWTKGSVQTVNYQLNTGNQTFGGNFNYLPGQIEIGERPSDGFLVGGLFTGSDTGSDRDRTFYITTNVTTTATLDNGGSGPSSHRGSAWVVATRTGAMSWANSRDPVANTLLTLGTITDPRSFLGSPTSGNPGPANAVTKIGTGDYVRFVANPLSDFTGPAWYKKVWYQYNNFDGTSGAVQLDSGADLCYDVNNPTKKYVSHMAAGRSFMLYCLDTNGTKVWTILKATTAGNFGTTTAITSITGSNLTSAAIQPNAFLWQSGGTGAGRADNKLWITDEDRSTDEFTINELSGDNNYIRKFRATSSSVTLTSIIPVPGATPLALGGGIGALTNGNIPMVLGTGGAGLFQTNKNGNNYIAYCFKEISGFSKFSSYIGNADVDGPFCYLGFKPAFLMWKRSDTASDWFIVDNKRDTYNETDVGLNPNLSAAESIGNGNNGVDFLSNGFKVRQSNSSINAAGGTYIYIAFAEQPIVGDHPATAK